MTGKSTREWQIEGKACRTGPAVAMAFIRNEREMLDTEEIAEVIDSFILDRIGKIIRITIEEV